MRRITTLLVTLIGLMMMSCQVDDPPTQPMNKQTMTTEQCLQRNGEVVGDIGNGAIHRSDYLCERTGKPAQGVIIDNNSGQIAIEGAVCC